MHKPLQFSSYSFDWQELPCTIVIEWFFVCSLLKKNKKINKNFLINDLLLSK
jgi:hypothetical protein